jgi:hypothetical protein
MPCSFLELFCVRFSQKLYCQIMTISNIDTRVHNASLASPLRAWYSSSISDFIEASESEIFSQLSANSQFSVLNTQRDAWLVQIPLLKEQLRGLDGSVLIEFTIPRMGRRIDVVVLSGPVVFAIEFKVGESVFDRASLDQVWDYALDLKNFHGASHDASIVPILVATEAKDDCPFTIKKDADHVYHPLQSCAAGLRGLMEIVLEHVGGKLALDGPFWAKASYRPTPTIVEAARALYAQHSVEAIARYDAGAKNLHITSRRIEELVDEARNKGMKVICFVTGVPGAGKTLVGLNVATRRRDKDQPTHAVFLSGNGPLVKVLREALTRDEAERRKAKEEKFKKGAIRGAIESFIQNVHHFRDDGLIDEGPPADHVVIFDEAQRAWNQKQTSNFMSRKKGRVGFSQSEPEFLISCMDRHKDWAVVVCLVGGGQEINTGEAGINSWLEAIQSAFPKWHMYISSKLADVEYAAGHVIEDVQQRPNTHFDDNLHLAVSMRSFRAESVSSFVKSVLDCEKEAARELFADISARYPITITRDLGLAKKWVRAKARGSERYGLIASSKAQRLKPHAIDIRVDVDPVHWFLNDRDDTRSSFYLEDAATEFQVQGLELDWACVSWDGDLRFNGSRWSFHDFRGNRWTNISNLDNQKYLRNAYRVLLTRARQGMVIFVPMGVPDDPTRSPAYYDSTFEYLTELGIPVIS